jgi:hypothetical protein
MNTPNTNTNIANTGPRQIKSNQMGAPVKKKKDKSNQIPAQTNQMKPNTSTDKSNQIEAVHLDVPLVTAMHPPLNWLS